MLETDKIMPNVKKEVFSCLPNEGSVLEGLILEKKERCLLIDLSPYGLGIVRGQNYWGSKNFIKSLSPKEKVLTKIIEWNNENGLIEISLENLEKGKSWEKIKELKENNEIIDLKIAEVNAGGLMGKIEDIKGFLPVSQLSTLHYPKVEGGEKTRILEKLKNFIGKEIKVKILDFDPNTSKLIFSEKLIEKEKMKDIINQYKIGEIVSVRITNIVDFGVFVKIEDSGIDGLIHISEISSKPTKNIHESLKEGELKEAKIIAIDNGRMFLSFKSLEEPIKNDDEELADKSYKN